MISMLVGGRPTGVKLEHNKERCTTFKFLISGCIRLSEEVH